MLESSRDQVHACPISRLNTWREFLPLSSTTFVLLLTWHLEESGESRRWWPIFVELSCLPQMAIRCLRLFQWLTFFALVIWLILSHVLPILEAVDSSFAKFQMASHLTWSFLTKDLISVCPEKASDWDIIAAKFSELFSTDEKPISLEGRASRERLDLLLKKYREQDAKALKRFVSHCVSV